MIIQALILVICRSTSAVYLILLISPSAWCLLWVFLSKATGLAAGRVFSNCMIKPNTLSQYFRTRIKVFRKITSDFVSGVGRKQSRDQNLLTGHLPGSPFSQGIRTKPFFPKRALQQPRAWPTDDLEQQCPASVSPDEAAAACWLLCLLLCCAHSSAEHGVLQGGCPNPTRLMSRSSWPHGPRLVCRQPCVVCCCSDAVWVQSMGRI